MSNDFDPEEIWFQDQKKKELEEKVRILTEALKGLLKYEHGKITRDTQTGEQVGIAWANARAALKNT